MYIIEVKKTNDRFNNLLGKRFAVSKYQVDKLKSENEIKIVMYVDGRLTEVYFSQKGVKVKRLPASLHNVLDFRAGA